MDATRSQYKYVYYRIVQDVPVIPHAERYDRDGKLVRELHASGLKKGANIWSARHVEMKSVEVKNPHRPDHRRGQVQSTSRRETLHA